MIFSVSVTMPDGHIEKMSEDTFLTDGNCLIYENGEYYHFHVGCCYKWNPETRHRFNSLGGWRLTSIEVARKLGFVPCLICEDERKDRESFWFDILEEIEDLFDDE